MGKTVRIGGLAVLVGVCVGLTSSNVHADYSMTLQDQGTGLTSAAVPQGGSITLDLMLASGDPMDIHDGSSMLISFDQVGLEFNSWDWNASAYTTGSADDYTRMGPAPAPSGATLLGSLPAALTSYGILFGANTRIGETFGTGAVVSFELGVPGSFAIGPVMIDVGLDGPFSDWTVNYREFGGTSTGPFTLNVTPEPATLMLLGLGGLAVLRRRRPA